MSEMVERVAQAIRDNIQAGLPDGVEVSYDYAAQAAIMAMRDPTSEMVSAGLGRAMPRSWQAMVDKALGIDMPRGEALGARLPPA